MLFRKTAQDLNALWKEGYLCRPTSLRTIEIKMQDFGVFYPRIVDTCTLSVMKDGRRVLTCVHSLPPLGASANCREAMKRAQAFGASMSGGRERYTISLRNQQLRFDCITEDFTVKKTMLTYGFVVNVYGAKLLREIFGEPFAKEEGKKPDLDTMTGTLGKDDSKKPNAEPIGADIDLEDTLDDCDDYEQYAEEEPQAFPLYPSPVPQGTSDYE